MSTPYEPGLHHVPSYQAAGWPYVSGSIISEQSKKFEFPFITKSITLTNTGSNALYLSFADPADPTVNSGFHQYSIISSASLTYDVRCRDIWVSASTETGFSLLAELTNISRNRMDPLTGSGVSG